MSVHKDFLWCDVEGCRNWALPWAAKEDGWRTLTPDGPRPITLDVDPDDRHQCDKHPNERGSVVIYMLGIVMVVIFFAGLSLDIWRAIAAERALATAVDAAAAAGANGIDETAYRNSGAVQLDPGRAQSLASDTLSQQPQYGEMDAVNISATADRVSVTAAMPVQLTLVRIFISYDMRVSATADAQPSAS